MRMRKYLYRAGAWLLGLSLMITSIGANFCLSAKAVGGNDAAREAYRTVVQQLVKQYGVRQDRTWKDTNTGARRSESGSGLSIVYCMDLTNDGVDELIVGITTKQPEEDSFSYIAQELSVYTFQNNKASMMGKTTMDSEISVWRNGDKYAFTYSKEPGSERVITVGLFPVGDRYEELTALENLTDAESEKIAAAQPGGLVAEHQAIMEVLFARGGMDLTQSNVILRFESGYTGETGNVMYATSEETGIHKSLEECLQELGVAMPLPAPEKILESVAYYGDRSKCKMDAKTAAAYADVLSGLPSDTEVVLVDAEGSGKPFMFSHRVRGERAGFIWFYNGSEVVEYAVDSQLKMINYGGYSFGNYEGVPVLCVECPALDPGETEGTFYISVSNGEFKILHQAVLQWFDVTSNKELFIDEQVVMPGAEYSQTFAAYQGFKSKYNMKYMLYDMIDGDFQTVGSWNNAEALKTLLQQYANGYSPYKNYDRVTAENDMYAEAIAAKIANEVGGEIVGIYELTDGVYYVVIVIDGAEQGLVVEGSRRNGEVNWTITEKHNTPAEAATLDALVSASAEKSNISLDYGKITSFKSTEELVQYLQNCLDNMDGVVPNDAAKAELGAFIESGLSSVCTDKISGKSNRLTVDGDAIEEISEKAKNATAEVEALLSENQVVLSKPITVIVRIIWENCNSQKPCQITLDKSIASALGENTLQLLLGDNRHYIQLTAERAKALTDEYEVLNIQFSKTEDNRYTVNFLTADETLIEQLATPITVGLPAETVLSTVMAYYSGGNDNWGGQFDENSKILSFETPYSGQYEVIENNIQIDDISMLSEESQAAIRFMVSKGYLTLDGNNFLPTGSLTRYQFTQALVGMFFALDRNLSTSFNDVPTDSEFYAYVASAEARNIVEGFTPTHFGGELNMTVEQMLALASRTLIDQKDYTLPLDAERYLTSFEDREQIDDWAKSLVAMAVRDGIADRGSMLNPDAEITREQAAVILYRLFLLLYEVTPVASDMSSAAGFIAVAAGAVLIICGAVVLVLVRKKKTTV